MPALQSTMRCVRPAVSMSLTGTTVRMCACHSLSGRKHVMRGSGLQGRRIHSLSIGTSSGTSSWLRASLAPLLIFTSDAAHGCPARRAGALHHSVDHPCSDRSAALGRLRWALHSTSVDHPCSDRSAALGRRDGAHLSDGPDGKRMTGAAQLLSGADGRLHHRRHQLQQVPL